MIYDVYLKFKISVYLFEIYTLSAHFNSDFIMSYFYHIFNHQFIIVFNVYLIIVFNVNLIIVFNAYLIIVFKVQLIIVFIDIYMY